MSIFHKHFIEGLMEDVKWGACGLGNKSRQRGQCVLNWGHLQSCKTSHKLLKYKSKVKVSAKPKEQGVSNTG